MADEDRSAWLASRMSAGVAALRAGRPEVAAPALLEVADDPELALAEDLRDIHARATSLSAQALLLAGRSAEALPRAERALALVRALGDIEGAHGIEQLLAEIQSMPKPTPREPMGARMRPEPRNANPVARAEWLVERAGAEIEAGRPESGAEAAEEALRTAPSVPRVAVLGRLSLARARPDLAPHLLPEAAEVARDAHEPTLLGLVARTAELLGIALEGES